MLWILTWFHKINKTMMQINYMEEHKQEQEQEQYGESFESLEECFQMVYSFM